MLLGLRHSRRREPLSPATQSSQGEARKLLEEIKEELDKRRAWGWLRTNRPESYEQLIEKLQDFGLDKRDSLPVECR